MMSTFLDLIGALFWPLVLSAAAWVIVINALSGTDESSEVVETLAQPDGFRERSKRGGVRPRRRH